MPSYVKYVNLFATIRFVVEDIFWSNSNQFLVILIRSSELASKYFRGCWQFCSGNGHVKTYLYNILQRLRVKSLFECYHIVSKHFYQSIEIQMSLITITLILSIYLGITRLRRHRNGSRTV